MESGDWEFVYDGVIGFLTSPMWQIPIMSFVEKNCIVFDPSEENCHSWIDSHKEYKYLVEDLLSSYLKDVGITEEQFVQACKAPAVQNRPQMQVVFEQIWATEDFEIYKRMMVQRNIDLELQALQLIHQQQESKKNEKPSEEKPKQVVSPAVATEEDEILKSVLRQSKLEYETMQKESVVHDDSKDKDIAKLFVDSHEDNVKILTEKAEEKREEMKKVVVVRIQTETPSIQVEKSPVGQERKEAAVTKSKPSTTDKISASSTEVKKSKELPPLKSVTPADAAASWLLSAKSEADSNSSKSSTSKPEKPTAEDLASRERYLQKQRDSLLALKNKEREKRLDTYSKTQPKRPTSARVARQAVSGNHTTATTKPTDKNESDNLEMRKALAERLKKEVLYK
eukprot:gene20274-22260_t